MVRGLDKFRDHFQGYEKNYVLIGGTASSLAMEEAGLEFRMTMDLDIVLCIEVLDADFVRVFWDFHLGRPVPEQTKKHRKKQILSIL
jgi:hypothetical protein